MGEVTITLNQAGHILVNVVRRHEDTMEVHTVDMEAIASWSKLLGNDDLVEVLDQIVDHAIRSAQGGDQGLVNPFTVAYAGLKAQEKARFDEEKKAEEEGTRDDPRSPELRGALAAYTVNEEVKEAQAECRGHLGLPDPAKPGTVVRMAMQAPLSAQKEKKPGLSLSAEERAEAAETISSVMNILKVMKAGFLQSVDPAVEAPLVVDPQVERAAGEEIQTILSQVEDHPVFGGVVEE